MQLQMPNNILNQDLYVLVICSQGRTNVAQTHIFYTYFGSSKPLDLADMWYDLTVTTIPGAEMVWGCPQHFLIFGVRVPVP